jgi:hypothetical protein
MAERDAETLEQAENADVIQNAENEVQANPQTPQPADDTPTSESSADVKPIATPTPGRIVQFTNEDGDSYPAIVSAVDIPDTVHLTVFDAVMGPRLYAVALNSYGAERNQWRWPERADVYYDGAGK